MNKITPNPLKLLDQEMRLGAHFLGADCIGNGLANFFSCKGQIELVHDSIDDSFHVHADPDDAKKLMDAERSGLIRDEFYPLVIVALKKARKASPDRMITLLCDLNNFEDVNALVENRVFDKGEILRYTRFSFSDFSLRGSASCKSRSPYAL